jgi:uncharacterized membrane protein
VEARAAVNDAVPDSDKRHTGGVTRDPLHQRVEKPLVARIGGKRLVHDDLAAWVGDGEARGVADPFDTTRCDRPRVRLSGPHSVQGELDTGRAGVALRDFVNPALLQLLVGTLLLVFGLQWVRKAVLRSAGLKALHDETEIFAEELAEARDARSGQHFGIDGFGFIVSYKGVLLEGLEVVFIVVTFGLGAAHRGLPDAMLIASLGAVAAAAVVVAAGIIMRRPLSMVPENTMKYAVGLLLSSFGVFWVVEGMGYFSPLGTSLEWPGDIWSLVAIFFAWLVVSRITVLALRPLAASDAPVAVPGAETGA